ncbi:hypothetical protein N657DRAFT_639815 [Parathielavia appendiculata]|uniref:Uncharacterized protein n=1 Tax=Parathielavia appendiculata TaxID=2587402 RepID=A0AAN6Z8R9_9PEZI|nr:hypothetical protein N657DRAFT_639815 [Parathielavia appendiculata]
MMTYRDSTPHRFVTVGDYSGLEPVSSPGLEPVHHLQEEHYSRQAWIEPTAAASPPDEPYQKILGLPVRAFWTIVILLVVVLAGAIGGGVGGGLAARSSASPSTPTQTPLSSARASDSPPSSSTTITPLTINTASTSTTTITGTATSLLGATSPAPTDEGCPSINGTSYTPTGATGQALPLDSFGLDGQAQQFLRLCDTNWPAGASYGNPGVHDIMKVYLPSLEACIAACAEWNANYERNRAEGIGVMKGEEGLCRAVSVVKAGKPFFSYM